MTQLLTVAWYAFALGSIIWLGVDARKRDFSDSRFASQTWQWVVGAIFLWLIVFPIYLYQRGHAPLKAV